MSSKFTQKAQNSLNHAMDFARELGHTYIGSEHLLLGLSSEPDCIAYKLLSDKGADVEKFKKIIIEWTGIGIQTTLSASDMTPKVKNIIEMSSSISVKYNQSYIGTEHLLYALLSEGDCMALRILDASEISPNELKKDIDSFLKSLPSNKVNKNSKSPENHRNLIPDAPTLSNYGRNLTLLAKSGRIDPIIGRDNETMRVIQILSRRTKNNPCLIGEPGVGKTAVVEGLAQRIADGHVPETLKDKIIVTLDIPCMIAGAKYRGEFEERMKNIMEEVHKNNSIILFIDEIHTIIGAGAAEGAVDAANIIKPALSRTELQIIGATTLSEYRKYIEKDAALERRFQPVSVGEPTETETVSIIYGLRDKYEAHHKLKISDDAIEAAVKLSKRYINERFLPDKAIDLIDEAAAAKRISCYTSPPSLLETEERLSNIANEKQEAIISQDFEKAAQLRDEEVNLKLKYDVEKKMWNNSKHGNDIIITSEDIERTLTQWTGIPISKTNKEENAKVLNLEESLKRRIIGQDKAIETISCAIRRSKSGLRDPLRPVGSFLFCGRSGVGKTELAKAVADEIFGESNFIRLDMSEYMEKYSIAKLIGSPPGYIGYDEGGKLIEIVRRHPYSVILFDEIEKAHNDIFNILLQIFDTGKLTDSQGKVADFKNTIIILTSNIGFMSVDKPSRMGFNDSKNDIEEDSLKIMNSIKNIFRPELINRFDEIIIFNSLSKQDIYQIAKLTLDEISERAKNLGVDIFFDDSAIDTVSKIGYSSQYGARNIRRTAMNLVENKLSEMILNGEINKGDKITVTGIQDKIAVYHN